MTVLENHRQSVVDFKRQDPAATAEAYAPDAVVHDPSHTEPLCGGEAIREDYAALFGAFPDIQTEIVDVVTNGNHIAYHMRLTGTHTGPMRTEQADIPASGRRLHLPAVFAEAKDKGHYITVRRFYDMSSLLQQLGVTPELQSA